jgi:phytoene dehydrogenase-like protein
MASLVEHWHELIPDLLAPLGIPSHPFLMARFGLDAMRSARGLAESRFRGRDARALFAGVAAHSMMPLENAATAAFAMVLASTGHAVGWPFPKGGAQKISDALASYFQSLGGEIVTGHPVARLDELPQATQYYFDLTPRQLLEIVGEKFPSGYRDRLADYRYGPGVFKLDLAIEGEVPWKAEACKRAGTVHVGGTLEEVCDSERLMFNGQHCERPYVLVAQHGPFDQSRAPEGHQTLWAYCHVPHGSTRDMTEPIELQLERFAPGIRERIIARNAMNTQQMHHYNANYIGGDINGGVQDLRQLFTRPVARVVPYSTPLDNVFICSSSTPPGGGVHGMCGYHAAMAGLGGRGKGEGARGKG